MKQSIVLTVLFVLSLSACNLPAPPALETSTTGPQPSTQPAAPPVPPSGGNGETIFRNGVILTMNQSQPTAEAMLVSGELIQAVGSNAEILAMRRGSTEVIDLGGLTLMPGFVDAHSHMFLSDLQGGWDPEPDQQQAILYGITTMTEMGMDQQQFDMLKAYADKGTLRLRLNAYLGYTTNCGDLLGDWWKSHTPKQVIAKNLTLRGIKIFTDGGSCKIPAVSVPYPSGSTGDLFFTQDQLNAIVAEVQGAGFQAAIHALGDRAVEQTQNAIAAALNGQPNTYRHRIEHNGVVRPDMMARYSQIGIVPVIFGAYSTCTRTSGRHDFKYLLPDQYLTWEWPWRALLDANPGLPIAWHADYGPLHFLNPMYILWGFVTRNEVDTDGSICVAPEGFKEGAIRVDEALPIMTMGSAYALFMDDQVGSLEPEKLADLIILSSDPLHTPTDALKDIQVFMTMIGGKVEYCAAGRESLCPSGTPSAAQPPPAPGASSAAVTASAELADGPAANARDGNPDTIWNSGSGPEQWIMLNLGQPQTVNSIRLTIAQYPNGETTHQVWVGADPGSLSLAHEFAGYTSDSGILEFFPPGPLTGVQYIRIVTTRSPSWVAWREIEIR